MLRCLFFLNSCIRFLILFESLMYYTMLLTVYFIFLNRYADLKNNRLTNYTFSFDQMLNDKVCWYFLYLWLFWKYIQVMPYGRLGLVRVLFEYRLGGLKCFFPVIFADIFVLFVYCIKSVSFSLFKTYQFRGVSL